MNNNVLIFETKEDTDKVLANMNEIIDKYNVVSVSDLYELIGFKSTYADSQTGWTSLKEVKITQVSEGFQIEFPKAETII